MGRIDDLTRLVSLRVDEYLEDYQDSLDSEIPMGDIPFELDEATTFLLRTLPRHLTNFVVKEPDNALSTSVSSDSITIDLPEDYLRFNTLHIKGWKQKATDYMPDNSPMYRNQQYRQLRATPERPMVFLIANPSAPARASLQAFPKSGSEVTSLLYVPDMGADDMPADFDDALIWKAASNILQIMRMQGLAQQALEQMKIVLGNIKTGMAGEGQRNE